MFTLYTQRREENFILSIRHNFILKVLFLFPESINVLLFSGAVRLPTANGTLSLGLREESGSF